MDEYRPGFQCGIRSILIRSVIVSRDARPPPIPDVVPLRGPSLGRTGHLITDRVKVDETLTRTLSLISYREIIIYNIIYEIYIIQTMKRNDEMK